MSTTSNKEIPKNKERQNEKLKEETDWQKKIQKQRMQNSNQWYILRGYEVILLEEKIPSTVHEWHGIILPINFTTLQNFYSK
jgi:hypothetical protein